MPSPLTSRCPAGPAPSAPSFLTAVCPPASTRPCTVSPRTRRLRGPLAACLLATSLLLGACAGYGPAGFPPGASSAQVVQVMGLPTGQHDLRSPAGRAATAQPVEGPAAPTAVRRLEFARGPFGKHTYMLDFDADDRLVRTTQVMTENQFNAILPGMGHDEVLIRLGRPANSAPLSFQRQQVWSYRFDGPFCLWFRVGLSVDTMKVVDSAYLPDPLCDDDGFFPRFRR